MTLPPAEHLQREPQPKRTWLLDAGLYLLALGVAVACGWIIAAAVWKLWEVGL